MMKEIDLPDYWSEPLIFRHPFVVNIDDFLEDEDLPEKHKIVFSWFVLSGEYHFSVRIDFARIPHAKSTEVNHVFVLLIEEVMDIRRHEVVTFSVKPLGKPFDERFLAMDIQAEKIDCFVEAKSLLFGCAEAVIERSFVERNQLRSRRPFLGLYLLRPLEVRIWIDVILYRRAAKFFDRSFKCIHRCSFDQVFSRITHCQFSP